jgi:hypothetical protein
MLARKIIGLSYKTKLYGLLNEHSITKSRAEIHLVVGGLLTERGVEVGVSGADSLNVYSYGKLHNTDFLIGFTSFKLEVREGEELINMSISLNDDRRGLNIGPLLCAFAATHPLVSDLLRTYVIQSDYSYKGPAIRTLSCSGMFDVFQPYVGAQYRAKLKQQLS